MELLISLPRLLNSKSHFCYEGLPADFHCVCYITEALPVKKEYSRVNFDVPFVALGADVREIIARFFRQV